MEADSNSNYMPLGRFYSNMAAKLKNTASWWKMVCKRDVGTTQAGRFDIPEKLAGQTKIIWTIRGLLKYFLMLGAEPVAITIGYD